MNELYGMLSISEQKIYEKVMSSIASRADSVSILGQQNSKMMQHVLAAVAYDHPEIFYVDFQHLHFRVSSLSTSYLISYSVNKAKIDCIQRMLDNWVCHVRHDLRIDLTPDKMEICRKVHNYLIHHVKYNYDALQTPDAYPDSFTVKGVFEQQTAVCEGISKSFKLLCNRFGVDVLIMTGKSTQDILGNSTSHVWNIVKTENGYAHVDVTWDLGMSEGSKSIRYDYYMIPDEWIAADHEFNRICHCDLIDNSYFVSTMSLLSSRKELKEYIDTKCKQKRNKLYFKIISEKGFPDDIISRVQKLVEKELDQTYPLGYSLSMIHNEAQNIFYFKLL